MAHLGVSLQSSQKSQWSIRRKKMKRIIGEDNEWETKSDVCPPIHDRKSLENKKNRVTYTQWLYPRTGSYVPAHLEWIGIGGHGRVHPLDFSQFTRVHIANDRLGGIRLGSSHGFIHSCQCRRAIGLRNGASFGCWCRLGSLFIVGRKHESSRDRARASCTPRLRRCEGCSGHRQQQEKR
jgi:hypothetical protein